MHMPIRPLVGYIGVGGPKFDVAMQWSFISMIAGQHGHEVLAVYEEAAGRSGGWPELDKAIDHARQTGTFLVVARPGRPPHLRVRFWAKLAEANVPIVLPIGKLTPPDEIRAMAVAARSECAWIGYQTKDAMFWRRESGAKFGTPRNLTPEARRKGDKRSSLARSLRATEETITAAKIALRMRSGGLTLQAIADHLNSEGHKTSRARRWSRAQVKRVLDRLSMFKRMLDQNRRPTAQADAGKSGPQP
jgi:hypothetical protein